MPDGQLSNRQRAITFHIGGNIGDEFVAPLGFLGVEMALIGDVFAGLHLLHNLVELASFQSLIAVRLVDGFLNCLDGQTGFDQIGDKVPDTRSVTHFFVCVGNAAKDICFLDAAKFLRNTGITQEAECNHFII
jgi:hypothetical protein